MNPIKSIADRRAIYIEAVTRGEGFLPWQARGPSPEEARFRDRIEERKRLLLKSARVRRPALLSDEDAVRARRNIRTARWGRAWFDKAMTVAEHIVAQDDGYIEAMIEPLTPWTGFTFFCPNCYGRKSFGGAEYTIIDWDYRRPESFRCKACGHAYPSRQYPETARLVCPRADQTLTFFVNDTERAHPDNRGVRHAHRWAGRPVHPCFSGIVRERKCRFMIHQARALALLYRLTDRDAFATRAVRILWRLADCFRHAWLYHDYGDTVADCDPLYAAWHDRTSDRPGVWHIYRSDAGASSQRRKGLPLEWKRNLFTDAYAEDRNGRASMLQSYWGAGRFFTCVGGINELPGLCLAFDVLAAGRDRRGRPFLSPEERQDVIRDLFLEWILEAEPYVGDPVRAPATHNKAPIIYHAMAAVARCLGIPEWADVAARGYRAILAKAFTPDGFSRETPGYTDMKHTIKDGIELFVFAQRCVSAVGQCPGLAWPGLAADHGGNQTMTTLIPRSDGGWETTGLPYAARVSPQGYLESLKVNGFEFVAAADGSERGLVVADGRKPLPFTAARAAGDALTVENADARLILRFLSGRIEIFVKNFTITDGHCVRLGLKGNAARVKNPDTSVEYGLPATTISGRVRLIAGNGAGLTLPGAYLEPSGKGYVVRFPWVMPRGPEATFPIEIAPQPLVEDTVQVTARAPSADFTYWLGDPQPFTTEFTNMTTDAALRATVVLRLKPYLTKTVAREWRQPLSLGRGDARTLTWTLERLDPSLYVAEIWLERKGEQGLCAAPRLVFHASALLPPAPPEDFDAFWRRTLAEQAKIPLDWKIAKVKDQGKSEVYKFSFAGLLGQRCYGYLTVPQDKSRKYPAVLILPSAGVHRLQPPSFAGDDRVGMAVNIAWVDVDLPDEQYDWRTWPAPYLATGILDKDYYGLRFSYAACVRAARILAERPEAQADNILVVGSSQGGGLALVTAGLYSGFKAAVANVPGLCRLDWNLDLQPSYFPVAMGGAEGRPPVAATLRYFDAAQFARRIKCPIWVSVGLMDDVTPSMGVFCAYNAIPASRKKLMVQPFTAHGGGWDYETATQGIWP